jgi:phospholipid transport system substrate-binding protein
MSASVLARHWRRASADEREAFVTQFRRLLVRTYYSALEQYADREVRYEPTRVRGSNSRVVVRSLIDGPSGAAIPVNYSMYAVSEGSDYWKVYDVQIDGISLVINYRASFDTEVKQRGLAKLVDTLREKNDAAMAEAGLSDGSAKASG